MDCTTTESIPAWRSVSECSRCKEMEQELAIKDDTIEKLMETLQHIHLSSALNIQSGRLTRPNNLGSESSTDFTAGEFGSVSSGSTPQRPSSADECQSSSSTSSSQEENENKKSLKKGEFFESLRKVGLYKGSNRPGSSQKKPNHSLQETGGSNVITIQEIIDRVIEKGPKNPNSSQTNKVEVICDSFNKLLSQLDSKMPTPTTNECSLPRKGHGGGSGEGGATARDEDESNSDNEQSFVVDKRPRSKCVFPLDLSALCKPTSRLSTSADPVQSPAPPLSPAEEPAFNDNSSRKRKKSSYSVPLLPSSSDKFHHRASRRDCQYYHHHHILYVRNKHPLPFQQNHSNTDSDEELLVDRKVGSSYLQHETRGGSRPPRNERSLPVHQMKQSRKMGSSIEENSGHGAIDLSCIDIGIKVPKELCVSLVQVPQNK